MSDMISNCIRKELRRTQFTRYEITRYFFGFTLLYLATATLKKVRITNWRVIRRNLRLNLDQTILVDFSSISADPFRYITGVRFTRRIHTYIHTYRASRQFTQLVAWRFINLRYCKPINKFGRLLDGISPSPPRRSFSRRGDGKVETVRVASLSK